MYIYRYIYNIHVYNYNKHLQNLQLSPARMQANALMTYPCYEHWRQQGTELLELNQKPGVVSLVCFFFFIINDFFFLV